MRRTSRFLAAVLVLLQCFPLIPHPALAVNVGTGLDEVRGLERNRLEEAFSRCDRETSPGLWLAGAEAALPSIIASWESVALELYADPDERAAARDLLRAGSEAELERRFAAWLHDRFLSDAATRLQDSVSTSIHGAMVDALYRKADDGTLVREASTGDLIPNEGEALGDILGRWTAFATRALDAARALFSGASLSVDADALSLISDGHKESMAAALSAQGAADSRRFSACLDALVLAERRLLVARRTGDLLSLRKKSEDASASKIAARLAEETLTSCASGIEALSARLDEAISAPANLEISGRDWLASYRNEFNRGLLAWKGAEERLLSRRIEWEQQSGSAWNEGMELWAEGFRRLEEERLSWEKGSETLLSRGEEVFASCSQDLESRIASARAEFTEEASLRLSLASLGAGSRAETWIVSNNLVASADESISLWLSKLAWSEERDGAVGSDQFTAWLNKKNAVLPFGTSRGNRTAVGEVRTWLELKKRYQAAATEASAALVADVAALSGGESLRSTAPEGGLDEYQVELIRARALCQWWERRLGIARAVAAYAGDNSASRDTEAESRAALEAAQRAYEALKARWGTSEASLCAASAAIAAQRTSLDTALQKLADADASLEALNREYALKSTALILKERERLATAIADDWDSLQTVDGYLSSSADSSLISRYLGAGEAQGRAEVLAGAVSCLAGLLDGLSALSGLELERRLDAISLFAADDAASWYRERTGRSLGQEDLESRLCADLELLDTGAPGAADPAGQADPADSVGAERASARLEAVTLYASSIPFLAKARQDRARALLFSSLSALGLQAGEGSVPALDAVCTAIKTSPLGLEGALTSFLADSSGSRDLLLPWQATALDRWQEALIALAVDEALRSGQRPSMSTAELAPLLEARAGDTDRDTLLLEARLSFGKAYDAACADKPSADTTSSPELSWQEVVAGQGFTVTTRYDPSMTLNRVLGISPGADAESLALLASRARMALSDPAAIDAGFVTETRALVAIPGGTSTAYRERLELLASWEAKAESLCSGLVLLGKQFAQSSTQEALLTQMRELKRAVDDAAATSKRLFEAAELESKKAGDLGEAWNRDWEASKTLWQELDAARLAWEQAAAIRSWASSAYLAVSGDDLAGYRSPLESLASIEQGAARARASLDVLTELYTDADVERPYEDPGYAALYERYRADAERLGLCRKAHTALSKVLEKAVAENEDLYKSWQNAASMAPPALDGLSVHLDGEGRLRLNRADGDVALSQDELEAWFSVSTAVGGDRHESTAFERSVREWSERMSGYKLDAGKLETWALARDYLVGTLPGTRFSVRAADQLRATLGVQILNGESLGNAMDDFRSGDLTVARAAAWNALSPGEQADLEFWILLSTTARGPLADSAVALESASELQEYRNMDARVNGYIQSEKSLSNYQFRLAATLTATAACVWFGAWYFLAGAAVATGLGIWNRNEYQTWDAVRGAYLGGYQVTEVGFQKGASDLLSYVGNAACGYRAYSASCGRVRTLQGLGADGEALSWSNLETALTSTGALRASECSALHGYWQELSADGEHFGDSLSAMAWLEQTSMQAQLETADGLESSWAQSESERTSCEADYRAMADRFIAGSVEREDLRSAARAAYGRAAPSRQVHLSRLESLLRESALDPGNPEGVAAYTGLLRRATKARYESELAAREAAWDLERRDLAQRREEWRSAAALALERGRADWAEGSEDFKARFNAWESRFARDREDAETAWNVSSLELARKKAAWLGRCEREASGAASEELLALVGSSAADAARAVDLLAPGSACPSSARLCGEVDAALAEIYHSAGIARCAEAMNAAMGLSPESVLLQQRPSGGMEAANARLAFSTAAYLRESSRELSERNSALLAASVGEGIKKALEALRENVDRANESVRRSLDEHFVQGEKWSRADSLYQKDVVVHSTVDDPVITERVSVPVYRNFVLRDAGIATKLSPGQLSGLSASSVDALIARARDEVRRLGEEVFGTAIEKSAEGRESRRHVVEQWERDLGLTTGQARYHIVSSDTRYEDAGAFGSWVGYDPVVRRKPSLDNGMEGVLADPGRGEIGRLLSSLIYWSMKERQGWALVSQPVYDKGIWDDRDSFFKAPSIRQAVSYSVGLAAGACTGGLGAFAIGLIDDGCFSALDVYTGHKTWQAAGIDFGKSVAGSAAGAGIGYGFEAYGAGLGSSGVEGVFGHSALTGARYATSGVASSAIGAVGWNGSGLSFDSGTFSEGLGESLVAGATGFAGSLTTGSLGLLNRFDGNGDALTGSVFRREDMEAFNGWMGSLAGEGLGFALDGDFSLNLLNLSILGNDALSGGLLELRLGRDDIGLSLGSGGLDVSAGALLANAGGLRETLKIGGAKLSAARGDRAELARLNAVNKLGYSSDSANIELARKLWGDELAIEFVDMADRAEYVSQKDPSSIRVRSDQLGLSREDAITLATVLSHEGTHVDGNRVEALAHIKALATNGELNSLFGLESDPRLLAEMAAGTLAGKNWTESTGDRQLWELSFTDTSVLARFNGLKDLRTADGKLLAPSPDADRAELVNYGVLQGLQTRYPDGMPATIDSYYSQLLSTYNRQVSATKADLKQSGQLLDTLAAFFDTHGGKGTWNESYSMSVITERSGLERKALSDVLPEPLSHSLSIDVTDLLMRRSDLFTDAAKRELAGNRKLVGDTLFRLIERPFLSAATIGVAQNLVTSPDADRLSAALDPQAALSSGLEDFREALGLGGAEDSYRARALAFYNASSPGILSRAQEMARSFSFEDQNTLSNALDWGFLTVSDDPNSPWLLNRRGERTSSLCHALSILTACDLNSMVDTNKETKEAFLNWARGEGLILRNGMVNASPAAFAGAYRQFLVKKQTAPELKVKALLSYGLSDRFSIGRSGGIHSAVIDTARPADAGGLLPCWYNPWKKDDWGGDLLYASRGKL